VRLRCWLLLLWCGCGEVAVIFPADDAGAPPCSASHACQAPLVCDVSGECVECVTDASCAAPNPACDPATHRCVPCRGTLGCTAPYVCSPSAPFCVLPCTDGSSGSCPGFLESCRSNVCSSCNEDEDCALGTFCDAPHGRCVACLSDANCTGATPRCNQGRGMCEACLRNADCPAGGTCFQGTCRAPF
jgi:Cys-rich repeat protein